MTQVFEKIREIILEVVNNEEEEWETIYIWISYITSFGFCAEDVWAFAEKFGLPVDLQDYDPAYPDDEPGSVEISKESALKLQNLK